MLRVNKTGYILLNGMKLILTILAAIETTVADFILMMVLFLLHMIITQLFMKLDWGYPLESLCPGF